MCRRILPTAVQTERLHRIFFVSLIVWTSAETSSKLPRFCQRQGEGPECEMKSNPERVTCRKGIKHQKEFFRAKVVYLCSWSLDYVDPEKVLREFPFVQKLTIRDGNVTEFSSNFPESKYLRHLTLAGLNIRELSPELFVLLENLKFLDLSRNRLKNFPPGIIKSHPSLLKVILIDNPWNCTSDLEWILDKSINSKISNKNLVQCGDNAYPGKPVYFVMSLIMKMRKDCPEPVCSCTMNNIVWDTGRSYLVPVITVNCTGRGLTEMPKKLPHNTTSLVLSRNSITGLRPLIHNKGYSNIADIYLDYNKVKSIDVLEGADWLKTFRVLSLKGNELSQVRASLRRRAFLPCSFTGLKPRIRLCELFQLPIYALDNAFEKNRNMAKIYLGHNPWKCDCLFIPEFQHLLIKYGSIVKDKNDIKCSQVEDDDNSNRLIATLSTNSVCRKPNHGINPLDILSAVFAFLILLILGKLLWDYWAFKKTGKLPWIVTKMP